MSKLSKITKKLFGDGGEAFVEGATKKVKENSSDILKIILPLGTLVGTCIAVLHDTPPAPMQVDPYTKFAMGHYKDIQMQEYTHIIFK